MNKTLTVRVADQSTGEALLQQLHQSGVEPAVSRTKSKAEGGFHSPSSLTFTGHVKIGLVDVETTPGELFEIILNIGPTVVDAVFNTLDRFGERIELLIDGKRTTVAEQRMAATFAPFLNQ